jgi:hypothetical protein
MEAKKFSPKDAKLIRENPGKSPGELSSLGLSKSAYNKLTENTVTVAILEPVKVETLVQRLQAARTPNHVVRLLNKSTNVVVELGHRAANSVKKMCPDQFEILS